MSTKLDTTIASLLAPGKGLLAADESTPSIQRRFASIHLASTGESRAAYREMLFTTPRLADSISGVILFDETLRQRMENGIPMPDELAKLGIVPGIKVDEGAVALAGFPGEKFTQGLDHLRERLAEYVELGARFTKWRAVIAIGGSGSARSDDIPTAACIETNAAELAQFAALSQEAGLVPIVEPEVLMDGPHTIGRCEEVITQVLNTVFDSLVAHRVILEQMLLKTGMVISGNTCIDQAPDPQIAEATLRCLRRTVPAAVPGIVFLSGGQAEIEATERLNLLCQAPLPWTLTFSYGRALQDTALKTWSGSEKNIRPAQFALLHRAKCNSLAALGKYTAQAEHAV